MSHRWHVKTYGNSVSGWISRECELVDTLQAHDRHNHGEGTSAEDTDKGDLFFCRSVENSKSLHW